MPAPTTFEALRQALDAAVLLPNTEAIAQQVKVSLQQALGGGLELPPALRQPRPDTYARRLLHRDPEGRYTAIVMTWGPGQGTALHDHAGIWCVECVVDGEMEVRQYDLVEQRGERFVFEAQPSIEACRGSAGCLIPPYEYHTLSNRLRGDASVTLHVYGGEMTRCHAFEPLDGGGYRRVEKQLRYHN